MAPLAGNCSDAVELRQRQQGCGDSLEDLDRLVWHGEQRGHFNAAVQQEWSLLTREPCESEATFENLGTVHLYLWLTGAPARRCIPAP